MDREETEGPKPIVDLVNSDRIEATIVVIPEGAASAGGTPGTELVNRETREGSNMNPSETVVVIDSDRTACGVEDGESIEKKNGMGLRKDFEKRNVKSNKENPVLINVRQKGGKGFNEEWNGERVCRICHLASDQASGAKTGTSTSELIQLGCDCKDELGITHTHCAEAWFKLKGNRMCEICGETAKNVEGVGDNRFMEEWNEGRSVDSNGNISNRGGRCWRGQPFCNFLMACLVIAFVLPWFFRINIF
ncbi:uncharacterized protein LOC111433334 [Cucurbita moschata]|uniref:Uncharacterized protein LOC111433334 n=1 Tax=Cucurbita moschata TaxID=3662 RepID=A0A6J1EK57_CUCMO|nr:uncharacterized protein LOC111433334 [Cucurbita moschata]XP_022926135.1 uncharacterized protein LOC111433334 [Cucurbita moschata]